MHASISKQFPAGGNENMNLIYSDTSNRRCIEIFLSIVIVPLEKER